MTDTERNDLERLAEDLVKAEEDSRELDARIYSAVVGGCGHYRLESLGPNEFEVDEMECLDCGAIIHNLGGPHYTTSTDAAFLTVREDEGDSYTLSNMENGQRGHYCHYAYLRSSDDSIHETLSVAAVNPALAIVTASMKALAAKEDTG